MMFNEAPFLDRFSAAADAGFQGVEYLFPYEFPADAIAERLRNHHLENVLFNLAPGNYSLTAVATAAGVSATSSVVRPQTSRSASAMRASCGNNG